MTASILFCAPALLTITAATQINDLSAYYPSAEGHAWEYTVTKHSVITVGSESRRSEKEGTVTDRVTGKAGRHTAILSRIVNETNSTMGNITVRSVLHVRAQPTGVAVVAVALADQPLLALRVPQPLLGSELPGPLVEGNQAALRFGSRLEKQSPTSVEVPAGSFVDCLLAEAQGLVSGEFNGWPVRSGTIRIKSWYARGVGLVREDRTLEFVVAAPDGTTVEIAEVASKLLTRHISPP